MTTEPQPGKELAGLVAVVTGASSGIGRAIAIAFAEAGADVLAHYRQSRHEVEAVAAEIARHGQCSALLEANLAEPQACETLVDEAFAEHERVDIWVNNAGVDILTGQTASLEFEEKLDLLWRVDVQATIRMSRIVGTRMKEAGGGVIINIGWDQAETGMDGDSGQLFAATKGAVMSFTRSLAVSLAPEVRVNCLAPGWIRTAWGENASNDWQKRAQGEAILGRWGMPEDVATAARFLASPAASFVTGQILRINGGAVRS